MRPFSTLLLFLIALWIPSSGEDSRPVLGKSANMRVTPVVLDPKDPRHRQVGALTYLGGLRLTSRDRAFGGFSEMLVRGPRFTLVSDGGTVVEFRMGEDWKPTHLRFGDLPAGPGTGWAKGSRDSESIARDPVTGKIWVGFENSNMIWRYDRTLGRAEAWSAPDAMRRWDSNGGPEAMARMADGSFIVLSETSSFRGISGRAALRFDGDPTAPGTGSFRFGFVPPAGGYAPSDMAALPDGRLLVLVRRITLDRWFESKLVLLDPAAIRPDVSVSGQEIATLTAPLTRDNFEALAVVEERGRTILWIASDDNLVPIQQSLLMKFRLDLPPRAAPAAPK